MIEQRAFGSTGLTVSAVGLGAGQVGERDVTEPQAERLLQGALDAGVTLVDTALSYGSSEERIGRHLAGRRDTFVLSSKGGSGVEGHADWSAGAVRASVEQTLRRTRSEHVDVFFLHSCSLEVLRRGEVQDALDAEVAADRVRVPGYSGDNEALAFAAASGRFGALECSVNLLDRWNLHHVVGRDPGLGVIAKRPVANAPWRFAERPTGHYAELYWERLRALDLDPGDLGPEGWTALALRFSAYAPGVHTAIVGTANLEHLLANLDAAAAGPLPPDALERLDEAWGRVGTDWPSST
ncbi:aldo/keto reductase [Microlunatus flavus]|uniref:Predicted oxidoreductase n=1 Tax=Microlunatus flavus TaxID=1036181 RepID=A0A1H9CU12_9ACTN|nr:aldo/keto reductase [Microlunatus flavus]SEQ04631.1 Predicted oxidoreductase [Microlunatus flavus]